MIRSLVTTVETSPTPPVTSPAATAGSASDASPAAPSLADCLRTPPGADFVSDIASDPHGQGDLLGFGFANGTSFVHIDRVELAGMVTAGGEPITDVAVSSYALTGRVWRGGRSVMLASAEWNGAVLKAQLRCPNPALRGQTRPVTLRLAEVLVGGARAKLAPAALPKDADPAKLPPRLYHFEVALEDGRRFADSCVVPADDSFALPGYWDSTGNFVRDGAGFSLGCVQRGAAWCIHKGYLDDASEFATKFVLFQACARMMRADYCGDGGSYTKPGTMVTMWQPGEPPSPVPFPGTFEAAWSPRGPVCKAHSRWPFGKVGGEPACWAHVPKCADAAAAAAFGDPATLLFNASCMPGPCMAPERAAGAPPKVGLLAPRSLPTPR